MKKGIICLSIVIVILLLSSSRCSQTSTNTTETKNSTGKTEQIIKDFSNYIFDSENSGSIFVTQEIKTNPMIVVETFRTLDKMRLKDPAKIAEEGFLLAEEIKELNDKNNKSFQNIFVRFSIPFNASIVYDYNNTTLFLPKYFSEIVYVLDTFRTDSKEELLQNPKAYEYLQRNGFLNSSGNDFADLFGRIESSYSVFITDNEFKEFFKNDSSKIRFTQESIESKESNDIELPKARRSYWGEGEWLVSINYDEFTDNPIYELSQAKSAKTDNANMWLNIRYKDKELEVYIDFSTNVNLKTPIHVTTRIDQGQPKKDNWIDSTSKQAVFYPNNDTQFTKELMQGNKVLVLVESGKEEYLVEFDLYGLEKTLEPYLDIFGI